MYPQTVAVVILLLYSCLPTNAGDFSCYVCTGCPKYRPLTFQDCGENSWTSNKKPSKTPNKEDVTAENLDSDLVNDWEKETFTEIPNSEENDKSDDDTSAHNETRVSLNDITNEFACYMKYTRIHHEIIWQRGCIDRVDAESFCAKDPYARLCHVCYEENCNGSSKFAISTIFTIILAFFVHQF